MCSVRACVFKFLDTVHVHNNAPLDELRRAAGIPAAGHGAHVGGGPMGAAQGGLGVGGAHHVVEDWAERLGVGVGGAVAVAVDWGGPGTG